MINSRDIIKACENLEAILRHVGELKTDAIHFIAEKGLQEEFMEYHHKKYLERHKDDA